MYARRITRAVPSEVLDQLQLQERFECWDRGELEPMLEMYAEDAVFDVSAVFTDDPPVQGHEDLLRAWMNLREVWGGGFHTEPLGIVDLEGGRYVLDVRLSGKGTRSGVEVDQLFAFLYDVRPDGKIVRARLFPDRATALSEAGVSA